MESKESTNPEGEFHTCPNCYHRLPDLGQYCSHCGQKNTDGRITVMELLRQFFSDVLNLDAKIWRTLLTLFVPGKLTVAFFQGRQQAYVKPLRLFFIFAIAAIAAISFFEAEFTDGFFLTMDDDFSSEMHYQQFLVELDSASQDLKRQLPAETHPGLDSLEIRMHIDNVDSLGIGLRINWAEEEFITDFKVAKLDITNLSIDSIFQLYQVDRFEEKLLLRQNIRLRQQGDNVGNYVINQTVWMLLLLMPVLALFLKLLYIRRSFYYVEHLIFSFHVHAFLFLALVVLLLLINFVFPEKAIGNILGIGTLIGEIYFFMALKRVYQQSKRKTFFKFMILNLFYLLIFLVALILTIIISALLY